MPKTTNLITVTHAREKFSFILNRTVFCQENYIIQRNGKKLAVLLSFEEYQLIRSVLARFSSQSPKTTDTQAASKNFQG